MPAKRQTTRKKQTKKEVTPKTIDAEKIDGAITESEEWNDEKKKKKNSNFVQVKVSPEIAEKVRDLAADNGLFTQYTYEALIRAGLNLVRKSKGRALHAYYHDTIQVRKGDAS